jgi:hypothetical protein
MNCTITRLPPTYAATDAALSSPFRPSRAPWREITSCRWARAPTTPPSWPLTAFPCAGGTRRCSEAEAGGASPRAGLLGACVPYAALFGQLTRWCSQGDQAHFDLYHRAAGSGLVGLQAQQTVALCSKFKADGKMIRGANPPRQSRPNDLRRYCCTPSVCRTETYLVCVISGSRPYTNTSWLWGRP